MFYCLVRVFDNFIVKKYILYIQFPFLTVKYFRYFSIDINPRHIFKPHTMYAFLLDCFSKLLENLRSVLCNFNNLLKRKQSSKKKYCAPQVLVIILNIS